MSTVSYLDRFLEPMTEAFSPDVARAVVGLQAAPDLEADINVLREKANAGTMTPEEDAAYREFVEAVDVISVIQSKARQFLARHPA